MVNRKLIVLRIFVLLLFTMMAPANLWGQAQHQESEKTYTVGIVPQYDSSKIREIWHPILGEIQKLKKIKLVLKGSPSIPANLILHI